VAKKSSKQNANAKLDEK